MVGIKKEIDNLGRLVVPKEFRERYGLTDDVELVPLENGVLIRNPKYKLVKINEDNFIDTKTENDEK